MSLTVIRIRCDYEAKTGDMVALFDEDLFEKCKGPVLERASRHHLPEVVHLFTDLDPNVKAVDWYDFLAPLTCKYTRKKDGTWRVGRIHAYEDLDWDTVPAASVQPLTGPKG
jgi:hypothetical protein